MLQRSRTRLAAAGCLGTLVVTLAGCGGGGGGTTTTTPSAQAWAGDVCSAITTWKTAITTSAKSIQSNPTQAGIEQAASDMQDATKTLESTLKDLGTPETTAGTTAKSTVDDLQKQLQSGFDTIRSTAKDVSGLSGAMKAAATISGTLATMSTAVSTAISTLDALPTGELQQAFTDAPSCQALSGSK